MKFLKDLDIIEVKMQILTIQSRHAALQVHQQVVQRDLEETNLELEHAKKIYRKLMLIRGIN